MPKMKCKQCVHSSRSHSQVNNKYICRVAFCKCEPRPIHLRTLDLWEEVK